MKSFILPLIILLSGCSFKKGAAVNQTPKGHQELYSEPKAPKESENVQGLKRIVIASTNDIQGHYSPHLISVKDNHHADEQTIGIGGAGFISSYFNILRKKYKNVLLVDSGDIFPEMVSTVKHTREFYSLLDYDAVTVGLRDFNLPLPSKFSSNPDLFRKFAKKSKIPLVLSNLYEVRTGRGVEWKGAVPYSVKEIDGVKVGIIGLIPNDIVSQTPINNRIGLFLENSLQSTLRYARLLRSLGADMVVVMIHQDLNCGEEIAKEMKLPLAKVNFDPKKDVCNLKSPLGDYLQRLPPHLVDLVISGRNHNKTANFVNHTLVMSGYEEGKSFNYAEFFFDPKTKKIVKDATVVHQPVLFCHEFFKETNDCYPEDQSVDHKIRVPATFLGEPIIPDEKISAKFPVEKKSAKMKLDGPVVTKALPLFNADIAFAPPTEGSSQLLTLEVRGQDLFRILEEDFNLGRPSYWSPSPFTESENILSIKVQGLDIKSDRIYKIISDIEGVQRHPVLRKLVSLSTTRSLLSFSWNNLDFDTIKSQASAPNR